MKICGEAVAFIGIYLARANKKPRRKHEFLIKDERYYRFVYV